MGLDGFEFVEFAAPEPGVLEPVFGMLGFSDVAGTAPRTSRCGARATSTSSSTTSRAAYAAYFAEEHGPSACGMAFRVRDSHKAYERWRWSSARSRSTSPPGRWNCACRRSRASAARRCT
jgi:4-hydroxyphenylpyruvate dioxygenase